MAKSPGQFDVSWDVGSGGSFKEALGKRSQCGIYRLRIVDGASAKSYVGQAKNVVTRVDQHRLQFGEKLVGVDFRVEKPADLDQRELETIAHFDGPHALHNKQLTWFPDRPKVVLDGVLDPDYQGRWWRGEEVAPPPAMKLPPGIAPVTPFASDLMKRSDYGEILAMLRAYVDAAIPAPQRTVARFWTVERAGGENNGVRAVVRIRVKGLDVLTISERPGGRSGPLLSAVPRLSEAIVVSKKEKLQEALALKVATLFTTEVKDGRYRLPEYPSARVLEKNLNRKWQRRAARTVTLANMRRGRIDHTRHEVAIAKDILRGLRPEPGSKSGSSTASSG